MRRMLQEVDGIVLPTGGFDFPADCLECTDKSLIERLTPAARFPGQVHKNCVGLLHLMHCKPLSRCRCLCAFNTCINFFFITASSTGIDRIIACQFFLDQWGRSRSTKGRIFLGITISFTDSSLHQRQLYQ